MSKPFNIHDWQAKQRLIEGDPEAIKGKHYPDEDTVKKLKKGPYTSGGQNAHIDEQDLDESLNPEVSQKVNAFIKAMAKRYDYSEQDAVFAIMAALKQRNMDEANVTGTGASFNAGSGEGYMTPFAFKKKNKKD